MSDREEGAAFLHLFGMFSAAAATKSLQPCPTLSKRVICISPLWLKTIKQQAMEGKGGLP